MAAHTVNTGPLSTEHARARARATSLTVHAQTDAPWVAAQIEDALSTATEHGWHDVRLALMHAQVVHAGSHGLDTAEGIIDAIEEEASRLDMRAVRATAILDRYRKNVQAGAPPAFDDLASARVLLSDDVQPPRDRLSGLVNLAVEFDRLRLYELADQALGDATRIVAQLDDRAEAMGVIAHNRSSMLLFRAANHVMAGELDQARAAVARFDSLRPGVDGSAVPDEWMALLAAHRRAIGATIDDEELDPQEARALASRLSSIDDDLVLVLELLMPMSAWSGPPRFERVRDTERLDLALFLHVRALERSGSDPVELVAAVKRYAEAVASQGWRSRTGLQNGVSAMIEARSLSIERRALLEQATTDALTGLDNRRVFQSAIEERSGRDVTLFFVDLDHLKLINDTYGHQVGDTVLRDAGRILAEVVERHRPDVVARVGGDEFAVLIAGSVTDLVERVVDEFEIAMRCHDWPAEILGGRPTATAGSATGACGDGLITEADRDLYRRKAWRRQQGKPPPPSPPTPPSSPPQTTGGQVGPWRPPQAPRT